MKITKKKIKFRTPLVNTIINLERPLEKTLKEGDYITIKCHNTPGDNDSGSPKEWLVWKDKVFKELDGLSINTGPSWYTFTERLLTGDAKATFN